MKNTVTETAEQRQAGSFEELLSINVGKEVTITTVNLGTVTGKILGVNGDTILLSTAAERR